jgi:DNA-binding CsgD family transcriptional regulator
MQTPIGAETLVGRDEELARLCAFLDRRGNGSATAFLLEGEPGVGKTALWRSGVAYAHELEFRVLLARPSEPERMLSFAALADLLADAHDLIGRLPAVQRLPLSVALLLEDAHGVAPDRRAIGVALLATLRMLVQDRPLLIAVDDVQWVDSPSAAALAFALRRVAGEPLCMLVTERTGSRSVVRLELESAFPLERLELGPLSLGALQRLLRERVGSTFPRPILRRIHEHSGGNPFFALELARAMQVRGTVLSPADELPVPRDLERLLAERLERLPWETKEPLAAVAALAEPTLDLVAEEMLEPAIADGVLVLDGDHIRFAHPLLAAVAYRRLAPRARRVLHRRLAELVADLEQRARHCALGADGPDPELAAMLDAAAAQAYARGAPEAAADLAERAIQLTGPADRQTGALRRTTAAGYHVVAGDDRRARALLDDALADDPVGHARARVLEQLAEIEGEVDLERGIAIMREALENARGDDALEAKILALLSYWLHNAPTEAEPYARSAVKIAERVGDPVLLAGALCSLATIEFWLGRGLRPELWERALELDARCEAMPIALRPVTQFGWACKWAGDVDRSRVLLERARQIGYERGDSTVSAPLFYSCNLELLAGDWHHGLELARELSALAAQSERPNEAVTGLCAELVLQAHLGNESEARRCAAEALILAERAWVPNAIRVTNFGLSLLELSLDRPAKALEHARRATSADRERGVEEPGMLFSFSIEIEAAIAVGEWEEAEELLDWVERRAVRLDREWALACAHRCRGLLAGASGDEFGAAESFERALAEHERVQYRRFERARTLLAQGETLRRYKKRRAAREAIGSARDLFEELGAQLWAAKARRELARIGGRAASGSGLTEGERRIAELVATGKSNKEAAAALFVSVHTVEDALKRVYRKLGVHSRTELAHHLNADG